MRKNTAFSPFSLTPAVRSQSAQQTQLAKEHTEARWSRWWQHCIQRWGM